MTDGKIALRALLEKGSDTTFLREMIGFAAERLMALETEALCNAAPGERSTERTNQRNGYRDPQFYLRPWVGEDGLVCVFSRPYRNLEARQRPTRATGFERHLCIAQEFRYRNASATSSLFATGFLEQGRTVDRRLDACHRGSHVRPLRLSTPA